MKTMFSVTKGCQMGATRTAFFCTVAVTVLALLLYFRTMKTLSANLTPRKVIYPDTEGLHHLEELPMITKNLRNVGTLPELADAIMTTGLSMINMSHPRSTGKTDGTDITRSLSFTAEMTLAKQTSAVQISTQPTTASHTPSNPVLKVTKASEEESDERDDFIQPTERRRTVVLILTNARSGSTFLGQLFNQNSNVYYLFEPFIPFTTHCGFLEEEKLELLQRMLQCDFRTMPSSLKHASNVTKYPDGHAMCLKNNMCFYDRNTNVIDRYARECYQTTHPQSALLKGKTQFIPRFYSRSKTCGMPLKIPLLEKICKDSKIVAFKVLRICSIESIIPIFDNLTTKGYDLKVVHLVRDPRAIMSSRISAGFDGKDTLKNIRPETELVCGRYRRNVRFIDDRSEDPFWKQRYLRIRYEDLTQNVMKTVEAIYRFINEELPEQVRQWVIDSQPEKQKVEEDLGAELKLVNEGKGSRVKVRKLQVALRQFHDPYSMLRDPKDIGTRWRRRLSFFIAQDIQNRCEDIMTRLGYNIFETVDDMRNLTIKSYM